jgi:hypothetical protein
VGAGRAHWQPARSGAIAPIEKILHRVSQIIDRSSSGINVGRAIISDGGVLELVKEWDSAFRAVLELVLV